jgi:hypothetical protein
MRGWALVVVRGSLFAAGWALVFGLSASAEQTWTGVISDSMCVRHHESGAEGQATTDPQCTRDCVKGGSKYVLVVGEEVYAIANQDHAELAAHAGETVVVGGVLREQTITIASVAKK